MDRKEDQRPVYPPEYAYIEQKVRAAQERVRQLDEQIKNVPANRRPAPILKPQGFVQRPHFNREDKIASLMQEKAELKDTTFSQIEQELRDADPKLARLVKDSAREDLFPSEARKMSVQEKKQYGGREKDIEQSQDLMDSFFSTGLKKGVKDNQETSKETPKKEATSMSWRFSQGLGYTKAIEKTDKLPEGPSQDIDMDTLFPTGPAINEKSSTESSGKPNVNKDVSVMSARFSQGLSYSRANQRTDTAPGKTPERAIEPNKD